MVSQALQAGLQSKLYALGLPNAPTIGQFLNPFDDNELKPVNYPAIITNLTAQRSPEILFQINEFHGEIPVVIEYRTKSSDNALARQEVSMVMRAVIKTLEDVTVQQPRMNGISVVEIKDLVFDFVKFDGLYTGGAVLFLVMARDLT